MRIAVVAPSSRFSSEAAERVQALAAAEFPEVEILFHPQCFRQHHHFAGTDAARRDALIEVANDRDVDAIWIARGGYGACRVAEDAIAGMNAAARHKKWLGYSDAGYLLAGLYRAGFPHVAHGPVCQDVLRTGGEAAVRRALGWLLRGDKEALDPGLSRERPQAAFNLTVLGLLLGTPLEPDLSGHELLIEDVSEHMYRIDRALFHLTSNARIQRVAGLRLGRISDVQPNDPDFGQEAEALARHWCGRAGIPFLGTADIGHDGENRVVPFGRHPA